MTYIIFNKNKLIKPSNLVPFQSVKHWPLKHIFVFIVSASIISVSPNLSYEYVIIFKIAEGLSQQKCTIGRFYILYMHILYMIYILYI